MALLILAVMAGMAWQGVDGISRARIGSQAAIDRALRLQTALAQFEHDLLALYDAEQVPALGFDGSTLRVTRRTDGGVQIVAWALHGQRWSRWAGAVATDRAALQESWMRSLQLLGTEPGQLKVLEGVASVQVYFYRGNGWSNAQSSDDLAPAEGAASSAARRTLLPTGVRLVLGLAEGGLTRDIRLAPQWP